MTALNHEIAREATSLSGSVALVTGGAIGIGEGIAVALAGAGADVAVTCHQHTAERVEQAITGHGRRALVVKMDATDSASATHAVEETVRQLGRLDIVVANAGGLLGRVPLAEMSDDHWHDVLDVNLSSAFYLVRASLPHLTEHRGRIILISSLAAMTGGSGGAGAYAAAKAGMLGLTRALAKEVAARGITVNAIAPGLILGTPFHEQFTPPAAQEKSISRIPLGRSGRPADVASLVTYLASESSSFLTGEVINLSGGQELT
jgi:3-oxoacyl-[acyl-carrier protein] reductase